MNHEVEIICGRVRAVGADDIPGLEVDIVNVSPQVVLLCEGPVAGVAGEGPPLLLRLTRAVAASLMLFHVLHNLLTPATHGGLCMKGQAVNPLSASSYNADPGSALIATRISKKNN